MLGHAHLKAAWKRRRIILLSFAIVLTVLVAFSHRQVLQALHSMKRRAQVREVMNAYAHEGGSRYAIRGPLTVAQVEQELVGGPLDAGHTTGNTDFDRKWEEIKNTYANGDELYFFTSDRRTWGRLAGRRGYVLIRENKVVAWLVTFLN
jgi:hypothetical protein